MRGRGLAAALLSVLVFATGATAAATPVLYSNCKHFNGRYPHGVGKAGAHDRTKSGDPVTDFLRSTRVYNLAIKLNPSLDRDKDGVACEKH